MCSKTRQRQAAEHHKHTNRQPLTSCGDTSSASASTGSSSTSRRTHAVLLIICLASLASYSYGYNIDLPSYTRHMREPDSMFGFSIALHKGRTGYSQTNSLVVGAPKFNTSSYQQGVDSAGAVFRCGMNDGDCSLVRFDSSGNHRNVYGHIIESKSLQWLGATVSTSRDNDLIVACAPRYVFHTMTPTKSLRHDPVGTCFTSRNFTQFNEVSPCRTNNWGYHRQGSCQAGFSAAASRNGDRLYIGAPGSWYWQGQAYSISPDATFPYKPPFYQPFGTGGQAYSHDVTRPENQVFSTAESSSHDDDSYLGYSMVTGDFDADGNDDLAIGMPRGAGLLGKIVVNRWNMANIFNITGRQIGEYFGYALTTSDVDGDGLDDLIIGAPMFSEPGNVRKYDVGRVYILRQMSTKEKDRWGQEHIRDGYNIKGRFGLALTSLGDINRDGYGDFAVGAPYDGPEGRGVVYIFHGSANGPLEKPSQVIKSEDLIVEGAPYPRTFGFALSGGVDMDGNTYPDLAVGAYASDQVFIFKSRPVAAVNAMTTFITPSKRIRLEEKNCQTVRDGKHVSCTDIMTCWSYTGEYLPSSLEFDVSWVLDAKKPKNPRMFFLLDEGKNIRNQSISLPYGKTYCRNETVYVVDNVQDKLTPLEVETRYNLRSSRRLPPVTRRRREALEPIIDQNREIVQRDAINIQKNCGSDNICEPDLQLNIKTVNKYVLGSREPLTIEVLISNMNEDAFEAAFYMAMPKDLDFKKIQQIGDKADTPITCTAPSEANNYTLKCDIGNPLPSRKIVNFKVVMLPSQKVGMAPSYDFFMEANSTNPEKEGSHFDNIIRESIGIWVKTDLSIEGNSLPESQIYKASDYKSVENATKEEDLGPQVVHIYNIRNKGPSTIDEAVVLVHYPYETAGGDLLMYMTNQPETVGNVQCDPHVLVNSQGLVLDQNLVRTSYLEKAGVQIEMHSGTVTGSDVHIETSHGISGSTTGVAIGRGTNVLSADEKKRLEQEDEQDVSGDASFVHSQRANEAANAQTSGTGGGGNSSWSWSSSWNSSSSSDGRHPSIIVSTKNSSVYYDEFGRPHVVESSTEYVTSLERSPEYYSQQRTANYQQPSTDQLNSNSDSNVVQSDNVQQSLTQGGPHSTRGHIQMAGPVGTQTYQQSHTSRNQPVRVGSAASYNDFGGANSNLGKVAQGGHGFQAGTLDLGTFNHGSVDNELRQRSEPNNAGNYGYHQTVVRTGHLPQGASNSYHQSSSSYNSGNKPYYGMENEDDYGEENPQPLGQQQQWSQHSTSHRRVRRDVSNPVITTTEASEFDPNSPCKAAKCETLRCVAKNLAIDDGVWIAIRTRMVAKTMEKLASNVPLNISTMAVSYVTRLPFIGQPKDEIIKSLEVFYEAVPERTPVPDVVPLWVVVLAACAGALLLLLLALLLYKCGFFKRNRPRDHSMERQPLRNGYHGDEHL